MGREDSVGAPPAATPRKALETLAREGVAKLDISTYFARLMGRPLVRTAALSAAEVLRVRQLFGTVVNAFGRCGAASGLGWPVFRDAAAGRPVRPDDLASFRRAALR